MCSVFTLSNAKHGEGIVIGLMASSNSKGPQAKTTDLNPWSQLKSQIEVFN